ncbi:uncharacterized protein LOC129774060 [Toxorhynchites rutilus septentrionalis]|uniref:uncharacterized protein LOC129774060 n=1 Tax=Toxorhynchites rutilus septentrionalis TaxID=329112 RepID=UPI00247927AF|nr:uncharacterized protein LOC129774060 [Toxorhynchites rutilus septentrionalis]
MVKSTTGIPLDVTYGSQNSITSVTSANLFAEFFRSVFEHAEVPPSQLYVDQFPNYDIRMQQPQFSRVDIFEALRSVDASKGPDPDYIPPSFVKNCAASLATPVMLIFNHSLMDGIFADVWKLASTTPIFKAGNTYNVENYRPISILSCLAKVPRCIQLFG